MVCIGVNATANVQLSDSQAASAFESNTLPLGIMTARAIKVARATPVPGTNLNGPVRNGGTRVPGSRLGIPTAVPGKTG
eukprot:9135-Rhodomonas_salina.1